MSAMGDEMSDLGPDSGSEQSFRNDEGSFLEDMNFSADEHFNKDDVFKPDVCYQQPNVPRPMRPLRHQGPPLMYRAGPGGRPSFPPGYRGPRVPVHMPGNPHAMFMRPNMGPNRNAPPFDGYGPPMMNMPRGPPPRHPQHFQPRFPPGGETLNDEEVDESAQTYCESGMPPNECEPPPNPNAYQGMPPGMRVRGPPPYMMGPHNGPHPPGPHGGPPSGPQGGPFPGPGQHFSGPPFTNHGPPSNQSGGAPFNAPFQGYSGPNAGRPFSGPHGPPFTGPPAPNGPPGSNFAGPCPQNMGPSNVQEFAGVAGPNYGPHAGSGFNPPFNAPPRSPYGVSHGSPAPPPNMPQSNVPSNVPQGHPSNAAPTAALLPPPTVTSSNMPPGAPPCAQSTNVRNATGAPGLAAGPPPPPFSAPSEMPGGTGFSAPTMPPFPSRPPFAIPSGPPSVASTTVPQTSATPTVTMNGPGASVPPGPPASTVPGFQFPGSTSVPEVPTAQFSVPPGFPAPFGVVPRPVIGQSQMVTQPLSTSSGLPLHMMPPPVPTIPMVPPTMPPFRPPMSFMPPGMSISSMAPLSQPAFQQKLPDDIWVENLTAQGKSYYYNMRTRETRWDRPEGVTVVRQGEVERTTVAAVNTASSTSTSISPQKPPEVAVWSEYRNPEGKAYYHNTQTGETTWEKPKVLADWEDYQSKLSTGQLTAESSVTLSLQPTTVQLAASVAEEKSKTAVNSSVIADAKDSNDAKSESEKSAATVKTVVTSGGGTESKEEQVKTPKDNSRPVSSTAVPGTPWCVVWTGDDRAFFFNPSQRLSVWEKPEELRGRADVDRLLERQPALTAKSMSPEEDKASGTQLEENDGQSAAKKLRLDEEESATPNEEMETGKAKNLDDDVDMEKTTSDKIPVGMEAAKEAEERAARERATQPLELRVRRFRELLVEKQVSAFSTWEKELHKIVFDQRYLLLTSKERRQTFEAYVKERAEDERREKKNKVKERKEKFMELMEEAGLSSKSSFSDFSIKYAKDERFKGIEKSRERESMFQDFLGELRKREKDEKCREKDEKQRDKKKYINCAVVLCPCTTEAV